MRIAMIGSRGIPAGVGGVERVVEELARGLAARGHEVLVYSRPWYVRNAGTVSFVRRICTPGLKGKHLDTMTHTATASLDVLRRNVDVVHVHSPGPALWSWLPKLAGLPLVVTVHAPDWQRAKWSLPAKLVLHAGLRVGVATADVITAVSRNLSEQLAVSFRRPVVCVPNAITPTQAGAESVLTSFGVSPERYALHVGRIVPEKRLDVLLRAWATVKLDWPLLIAGDDAEGAYAAQCRREAPDNVHFLGPKIGEELATLYAHAGCVVQPSVLEGASLVLLEAAAKARCILCTDMPANREILGEAGIFFPADDVTQLVKSLRWCYDNARLRANLGLEARSRVASSFAPADMCERMEGVYRQAIARHE